MHNTPHCTLLNLTATWCIALQILSFTIVQHYTLDVFMFMIYYFYVMGNVERY